LRAYVDARDAVLKDYIDNVALGQIYVYNPTTGEKQDLQSVINSLFDVSREDALSASEYDALALTATYYDGQDISAYDYDTVGKTLLVG
jgi:helix-turn-helix protein